MNEFAVLVRKELKEQTRTKKIMILAIIFLFVAVASPIIAKLTPEIMKSVSVPGMSINLPPPTYNDALDQFIKNISQIALLVLVFVVAGAIADEKSKKTLEILLTKPISRTKFVVSKFVGYFISIAVLFYGASAFFYAYTVTTFGQFNLANFALMTTSALLYVLMIVAITILASTVVRNSIAAGGIGFISFVVFGTVPGLIKGASVYAPSWIFSNYRDVVANGWTNELVWPLVVGVLVLAFTMLLSVRLFKKQEIER